jgi:hypothetical protein
MAGSADTAGQLPWPRRWRYGPESKPRNLDAYVAADWYNKAAWHSARSSVAQSLNRSALVQVQQMGVQENMRHTPGVNSDKQSEEWLEIIREWRK